LFEERKVFMSEAVLPIKGSKKTGYSVELPNGMLVSGPRSKIVLQMVDDLVIRNHQFSTQSECDRLSEKPAPTPPVQKPPAAHKSRMEAIAKFLILDSRGTLYIQGTKSVKNEEARQLLTPELRREIKYVIDMVPAREKLIKNKISHSAVLYAALVSNRRNPVLAREYFTNENLQKNVISHLETGDFLLNGKRPWDGNGPNNRTNCQDTIGFLLGDFDRFVNHHSTSLTQTAAV
jgi:hypothetical protein